MLRTLVFIFFLSCFSSDSFAEINQLNLLNNKNDTNEKNLNDPFNRNTPNGTVKGFFRCISNDDFNTALKFFDFEHTPDIINDSLAIEFVKKFEAALTKRGKILPFSLISNNPDGVSKDGFNGNFDEIGTIYLDNEKLPIYLEQVQNIEGKNTSKIWLISANTILQLSSHFNKTDYDYTLKDDKRIIINSKWKGSPVEDWIAMIVIALLSFFIARLFTIVLKKLILRINSNLQNSSFSKVLNTLLLPLSLVLAVIMIVTISRKLELGIIVRQSFSVVNLIALWLALFIFIWMLIDTITSLGEGRLREKNTFNGLSLISFFRNGAKFTLVVVAILIAFNTFGFNLTAGIAALGVGGIALALGAQKTVENLVGGLSVVFDQPVSVGDFCKFGDTVGTVENIGIRSTRIRTLGRTIVTIPNADFSSRLIENYAKRDKFLFKTTIGLRYETTSDQMRYILVELRKILYAHPKVDLNPARVRFLGYGSDSLQVEIFAYVLVPDWSAFLGVQEDINFRIAKVIEDSGTGFAFPSQTIYLSKDKGLSETNRKTAESKVKSWIENGELQIPEFDEDLIKALKDTLKYPPNEKQ